MAGSDHELVSVSTFLDYRARRLRAPVADPDAPPDVTVPTNPEPADAAAGRVDLANHRMAVAVVVAPPLPTV